jgi:hypothetical protein
MNELYLAVMLICSLTGECSIFSDKTGPAMSIEGCRSRLDKMSIRVQKGSLAIMEKIGSYNTDEMFRGFCVNPNIPQEAELKRYDI